MFEFSKKILSKVSFDRILFKKELKKAIHWASPSERTLLKIWCLSTFGHLYQAEILEAFNSVI
ncbi:MAG: hypothetical protein DRI54_07635 [Bacteroidetes bacterium]|nr:MAG: hypothetical protein DRI54_07635 [Bacteroidota bacterium]